MDDNLPQLPDELIRHIIQYARPIYPYMWGLNIFNEWKKSLDGWSPPGAGCSYYIARIHIPNAFVGDVK
jgi:hypothetical protein